MNADPEILTVVLADAQRDQLAPVVRRAVRDRKGVIFFTAAPFIDTHGHTAFRLQAKCLDSTAANKVLRIVRQAKDESASKPS
jgi:hypothetical protein